MDCFPPQYETDNTAELMRVQRYDLDKIVYEKSVEPSSEPMISDSRRFIPERGLKFSRNEVTKKNCAVVAKVAYASNIYRE